MFHVPRVFVGHPRTVALLEHIQDHHPWQRCCQHGKRIPCILPQPGREKTQLSSIVYTIYYSKGSEQENTDELLNKELGKMTYASISIDEQGLGSHRSIPRTVMTRIRRVVPSKGHSHLTAAMIFHGILPHQHLVSLIQHQTVIMSLRRSKSYKISLSDSSFPGEIDGSSNGD